MHVKDEEFANYSFYRQPFCLPLNATGLSASLQLAGDDISDMYLNGTYLGRKIGAGAAATFPANPPDTVGIQSGINFLAVQLLNNRHGGHTEFSGGDHSGLLFNLGASYTGLRPFASGPSTIITGQSVTFTVDEQALGGRRPYEYKINFGDGSAPVAYQSGTTFTHTYNTPGTYAATLTARAAYGCTGVDTATVTVLPAASSLLANTATVAYRDTATSYHSFIGTSGAGVEVIQSADLAIVTSIISGGTTPGQGVSYQLVVTNNGPNAVTGAVVSDTLPAAVTGVTWSCTSSGGSCTTPGSGNSLSGTAALPSRATATYTIAGTISATATGVLSNTATVAPPSGTTDLVTSNNSSLVNSTLLPVTHDDGTYSVTYASSYTGNILTNDVGSLLTVASITGTDNCSSKPCTDTCNSFPCTVTTTIGSVYVQADGTFRYEPVIGHFGDDSFTYTARDSYLQTTAPATVSFNVSGVAAPVAISDTGTTLVNTALDSSSLTVGQRVNNASILSNDTGAGIVLTSVTGTGAACSSFPCTIATGHGSAVVQPGGTYVYTPATGYSGADAFSYIITDEAGRTATGSVALNMILNEECDYNRDQKINIYDIEDILAALQTSAGVLDPRDIDYDGLITINDANGCKLRCDYATCVPLPRATVGVAYSADLVKMGASQPYVFAVTSGTLPAGINLAADSGVLWGTPTANIESVTPITVRITETNSNRTFSSDYTLNVDAAVSLLAFSTVNPLPGAFVGSAYSVTFTASGGKSPYTFDLTSEANTLPAGLTFNDGVISGTPTTVGSPTFNIRLVDRAGRNVTQSFTINVTTR
jgi:uncharacterized repeat protein (TIGR01451 family)